MNVTVPRQATAAGFTLMELLLVIALLAVVAAVGAPQFFRSGTQAIDEARMGQMKTNYSTVKAAISVHLQDETYLDNSVWLLDGTGATDGTIADTESRISRLVRSGRLQTTATSIENGAGQQIFLQVKDVGAASGDNLLPPLNRKRKQLHVVVGSTGYDIDANISLNKTFETIWGEVKILAP